MPSTTTTPTLQDLLSTLPTSIHAAGQYALACRVVWEEAQQDLTALDAQHEWSIAFDTDLKNDLQRKAVLKHLQQEPRYQKAQQKVAKAERAYKEAQLEHTLLRDQLAAAKLQVQLLVEVRPDA